MTLNQRIVSVLMKRYYPHHKEDVLDAVFCAHDLPGMKILDAGCGGTRGCTRRIPLEKMHIVGIDIDPKVHQNPRCNETVVCDLSKRLPFSDNSFDLIHCRWVLEHLDKPESTFCEFERVLKPGGWLLALTPNIFHYAIITARITPLRFHQWWQRSIEGEVCSTFYRGNSKQKLTRLCKNAGLQIGRLELFEGPPNYLTQYWPFFLGGIFYERIVNSTRFLEWMRMRIILKAQKPT